MILKPWRPAADTAEDRAALQGFTCTSDRPPMGAPHPKPWELSVQSDIRQRLLKNTASNRHLDQRFQLAMDEKMIAAVHAHARMTEAPDELTLPTGVCVRGLLYVAVAREYRSTGLADRVMAEALYDIIDCEPDAPSIAVLAKIDYRNGPSERMCRRHGFDLIRQGTPQNPYGLWGRAIAP